MPAGHNHAAGACPVILIYATSAQQGAYVLGTITLLVVKSDERTGRYRDMSTVLKEYIGVNEIPQVLIFFFVWKLHAA